MDDSIAEKIRAEMKGLLPAYLYHSFIEEARFEKLEPNSLRVSFSDNFSKEGFEQKCLPILKGLLGKLNLEAREIELAVAPVANVPEPFHDVALPGRNPFDSKYTFETFVVGTSNQFAHAACEAVARQPGQCYNPLFIFGGAGLGKTHLLKAIGYELMRQSRNTRIHILTSESFTNELIQAIRLDRMREFREKYRTACDVLLLDDIHFLAGKERTQEEFFYTFNYLHESRKQIVITSDRYPKDIQGLENRLQTRFEWGLVADVQPPEIETRIAILHNKACAVNLNLPEAVADYIASHITTNIRELEGSLHRLQAYSLLTGVPISLQLAQQALKEIAPKTRHELTAEGMLKIVALQFNVRTADIKSEKRIRKLTLPRQVCMYLLRKHLLMSYPEIGKFMGGKDHTTVLHGVTKIAELQRHDVDIINHLTTIESLIR